MRPGCFILWGMILCGVSLPLWSQSINVDFGEVDHQPPATYSAAGIPGFWNSIPAAHGTTTPNIQDLNENVTAISIRQFGGEDLLLQPGPDLNPSDGFLLNDYLVTYNASLESCLFVNDMADGWYQILVYAWTPSESAVLSYTNCDEEPQNPHYSIGGVWSGQHQLGVTYALHYAEVSDTNPFPNLLQLHSGIVPGANPSLGAALNGVQIRFLGGCRTDITSGNQTGPDGVVDQHDLAFVIQHWETNTPGADMTGPNPLEGPGLDGEVNILDSIVVTNRLGPCPTASQNL